MGYASYIGRVGGLAVALGIGMAVASSPIASAQPSDSGSAAPSSVSGSARKAVTATPRSHASSQPGAFVASRQRIAAAVPAPGLGSGGSNDQSQSSVAWAVLHVARRDTRKSTLRGAAASATAQSLTTSPNLLVNPGAETGDPSLSGNSSVSIPGWTVTGTPTVIEYGTPRNMWPVGVGFALPNLPKFMGFPQTSSGTGGTQFFGGGNVGTSTLTQTVTLTGPSTAGETYDLSGQLGGWLINPGAASIKVDFLDANRTYLGTASIGPVTMFDRLFQTTLLNRSTSGTLPTGTQYAQVTVNLKAWKPIFPGLNADYNSAFADNISFTVSDPTQTTATLAPPVSTVGLLDHVFMVYMENKGYNDIVGSPNAPFLNSLINSYGFADNYYALTHLSNPNYYPIVGGTDFGLTYNCTSACIDASTTLVSNIDNAGKTWRAYAQGLTPGANPLVSSGDYSAGELPFPAYASIANNLGYAKSHILPLEQMTIDLRSTATTPSYAWFAADADFDGEGPIALPFGPLKFALNLITPKHQYNVPALDQFLSETVPAIMNSAAWKSSDTFVIVVTFDEDTNNLSLGFGNDGNHVVTVVIPNQAAIDAGMRSGPFVASDHLDHYSLLRMIEDSLGLPTLTNNDKYAAPMNEFWSNGVVGNSGNIAV